jgi:cobalamin biosynthesis protein CobD/CbiB
MDASPDDRHGTDLLLQEIKEETGRLVHHPVAEIKRLESVVEEGESAATPLILFVGVAIVLAVIAAVVMTVVFLAYYKS